MRMVGFSPKLASCQYRNDSDFGSVDARLDTRLAELQRTVVGALAGEEAA